MERNMKNWFENEVERACHTAKKMGLTGSSYRIEVWRGPQGRIFDGEINTSSLEVSQISKGGEDYPQFEGPAILTLTASGHTFEVGLNTPANPNGVLVKQQRQAVGV